MTTRTFTKQEMLDILDGDSEQFETVVNDLDGTSRWSATYTLVFKELATGNFYRTWYSCGLTEYQDESPWEYDEEIKCTEVEPVEVTVIKYEPKVSF